MLSCSISEKGPHSSTVLPPLGVLNSWSCDTPGCELRSGMNPLVFGEHSMENCQTKGPEERARRLVWVGRDGGTSRGLFLRKTQTMNKVPKPED